MAHHISAKKRIRRNKKREIINSMRLGAVRTSVKKVEKAIAAGQMDEAKKLFVTAESLMRKAVNKGVVKMNTCARKVSRLAQHIKKMAV